MPQIGAFYLSYAPADGRTAVVTPSGRTVYIAVEELDASDLSDAMDNCRLPNDADGETFMNTHYLTREDSDAAGE